MKSSSRIHQDALEYLLHMNHEDINEASSLFHRACALHNITADNALVNAVVKQGAHFCIMVISDVLHRGVSKIETHYIDRPIETLYENISYHGSHFESFASDSLSGRVVAILSTIQRPIDIVQLTRLVDDEHSDEIDVVTCLRSLEPFTIITASRMLPFPKQFVQWLEEHPKVSLAPGLGDRMIARLIERKQNLLYQDGYLFHYGAYHMLACNAYDVIDQMLAHQTERFLDKMTTAFTHCLIRDDASMVTREIERLSLDGYADEWLIEDTVQKLAEATHHKQAETFLKRQTSGLSELFIAVQQGKIAFITGDFKKAKAHFNNVLTLASQASKHVSTMNDVSFAHEFLGEIALEEGDVEKAYYHFNVCLETIDTLAQEDDRFDHQKHRAALYLQRGDLAFDGDDYEKALQDYMEALTVYENEVAAHDDDHSSLVTTLLRILDVYDALKDDSNATITIERLFDHAMSRFEKVDSVASFQDLAYIHARLGDRDEGKDAIKSAIKHYERVCDIYTTIHNTFHTADTANDVMFSHARLGELLPLINDIKQAEKHKLSALHFAMVAYHEYDDVKHRLNVVMQRNRLGMFYFQQADLTRAKRYYEEAHTMALKTLSSTPIFDVYESLAFVASNLGDYYVQTGDSKKALFYYQEAYKTEKKALNVAPDLLLQQHHFAYTCFQIGAHYMNRKSFEDASKYLQEASEILEMLIKEESVDSAVALLANVYMHLSEINKHIGNKALKKHYSVLAKKLNPLAYD